MEKEEKKSVAEIIISQFLKDVEESDTIPWTKPYNRYSAFNWYSKTQYRGINRLILPFGEYLTYNQMVEYNKKNGTNYRYDKENGKWWYVTFFKKDTQDVGWVWANKNLPDEVLDGLSGDGKKYVREGKWLYIKDEEGNLIRTRNILRYSRVADRKFWVDPDTGESLPSRIESGEVTIERFDAQNIYDSYIERSGVKVLETSDIPCFVPLMDAVMLNKYAKDEEYWWATVFHELAHSTMMPDRLNREFYKYFVSKELDSSGVKESDIRAKEECIAEIAASMVCSECNITKFETSESKTYKNNVAYVQSWKKRVSDWGQSFIYIVSEAEKAYQYIMGAEY